MLRTHFSRYWTLLFTHLPRPIWWRESWKNKLYGGCRGNNTKYFNWPVTVCRWLLLAPYQVKRFLLSLMYSDYNISNSTWRQHHLLSSALHHLHVCFYGIWIIWHSSPPAEIIRTETPTEETRALVVVTQCGVSPSDPDLRNQPHPQPAELKHHPNGTRVCFWPQAWRTGWSKSGTC